MIFTTRDLGVGGDLNIAKKLEMQPLTEVQMREFFRKYIPEQGEQMLRQLGNPSGSQSPTEGNPPSGLSHRLQEFGQTPLLLWMLCSLFKETGKVLPNLGLVLRKFTQLYDRQLKQDATVTAESRQWWPRLLQSLAFEMSQGQSPKELRVAIPRPEVEEFLTKFLQGKVAHPDNCALSWLKDLLDHHLIQLGAGEQIEFQHQLIQEYYTAESLLKQLPQLSDDSLKREYLNYLKWTEPLALMLELVDNEAQAERVVRLALEVDLRLGARLAGAVKLDFQEETIALVARRREIPQKVKIELLGITLSDKAIPALLEALKNEYYSVRLRAADALGKIGNEAAVTALLEALKDERDFVRSSAADALGKIGNEAAVTALREALKDEGDFVLRWSAADALRKIGNEAAVTARREALKDEGDFVLRWSAADALGKIGNEAAVTVLLEALKDERDFVCSSAADALGKIASFELIPRLSELILTTENADIFNTIAAIQERCKYYNHTLISPEIISIPPMYILHLSDLHFGTADNAHNWYSQLAEDLHELNCPRLGVIILSGDIANKSTPEEYKAAHLFLDNLRQEFQLQPQQIVIVPGNHDLNWGLAEEAYRLERRKSYQGELQEGCFIDKGDIIEVRDEAQYQQRFAHFRDFYQAIKGEPYPLEYEQQGILHHFPEQNLLILGLNSAWQLDHHYKSRASIHPAALSTALTQIRQNPAYSSCLKIVVWHHPFNSAFEDRITDHGFMEQLAKANFRFALHGHIHKAENSLYRYDLSTAGRKLDIVCAGTFGAPIRDWVPGYPLQYNLLKLEGNKLTVITRRREELNGAWKPDARWLQGAGQNPLPYYEIPLFTE